MHRYLVERLFPEGVQIPVGESGAQICRRVADNNLQEGVTWVQSYVTPDKKRTFCVYDGPTPEAVRLAATRNNLPIREIIEVRVLDPQFHR